MSAWIASPGFDPAAMVRNALTEDLGSSGDVTSSAVVDAAARGHGALVTREPLVLAGLPVAREVFHQVDASVQLDERAEDGQRLAAGDVVARVSGSLTSVLAAERVALNFLQHLSGVATQTARYVAELGTTGVMLLDTRKTTPGLRAAEKYAVTVGGGHNHRFALYDGVLIKDNHLAACGSVTEAVRRATRARHPLLRIEVEVENLDQALEAVRAGADALLLDNRSPAELRALVGAIRAESPDVFLEASGGIVLGRLAEVASTGVDAISSGAVIHGARWVDLALDLEPT
jgi:nicotinate-nucleotide pyrophosphorylase (carboxylating)